MHWTPVYAADFLHRNAKIYSWNTPGTSRVYCAYIYHLFEQWSSQEQQKALCIYIYIYIYINIYI